MSNDWQWNSRDWQQPDEADSLDRGLGNYPTQQSSGSDGSVPDPYWDPISLPPPPPTPPFSSYESSGNSSTPSPYSLYGQSGNPFGQPPPGGSYPFAPSPVMKSRPRLWFLIPLLIFVVLCAGGVGLSVFALKAFTLPNTAGSGASNPGSANTGSNGSTGPLTIMVGAHPNIVIDRNAGAVQIEGVADSRQVVIKPVGQDSPLSNGQILYTKNSAATMITFDLTNLETVDVLVMVPAESDLNITTNGDDITVEGVTGQQNLSSNAGSLHVSQDTLTGKSVLDTNGGIITFSGVLDRQSNDHFSTNPGSITIALPASAAFHADISNNGGVIQSAFPQVVISDDEAHGDVGKAPFAQLEVDSNGGTIQLKKGS